MSTLKQVARSIGGGTPSTADSSYWQDGTIPWVSPKDMKVFRLRDTVDRVTGKALDRLAIVPNESLLVVVRSGILDRTLPVAINDRPVVLNQDMRAFVPVRDVNVSFLAWQLVANTAEILDACTKDGTTVASIEAEALANFPVFLAPAAEQLRIIGAIESVIAVLDAAVADLEAAKRKLALYRQSLLKSAVDGSLTAEWRNENPSEEASSVASCDATRPDSLPKSWSWVPVEKLPAMSMANGRSVPTADVGAKVLRLTAVREGRIDLQQTKVGAWSPEEAAPFAIREGDLLIVRGNGSLSLVGRAGVVPLVHESIAYPDTLIRLRVAADAVRPEWLACVWDSSIVRDHLERKARTSAGIYKIAQPDIASVHIPVPPLAEQDVALNLFNEQLEQLAAARQSLETVQRLAAAQRQNILRAAFSGRLVPQDPNDEPAGVLLDRIRRQRDATPQPARRQRRAGTSVAT